MADIPGWHQQLQQLQGRLEQLAAPQIQAWAERWDHTLKQQADTWRRVGQEWQEHDRWGLGPLLALAPKDPHAMLEDQRHAIDALQRTREWLAANPTGEVQARLQRYAEAAREALQQTRMAAESRPEQPRAWEADDPEYLGWQAEGRFYQEQDPQSEWYRADLYHGEMGPDVRADYERTREEERLGAVEEQARAMREWTPEERAQYRQEWSADRQRERELEFERQEQAFDESQLRIAAGEPMSAADVDTWDHPFEFPTSAEQQAYEDRPYNESEERAHGGEEMERSLPYDAILVDTSNPEMEEDFQALLARLDQRLEALVHETESEAQRLQHQQGVRY
jgi:hypothetical protein